MPDDRQALETDEIEITPEMMRAGFRAFESWRPEQEEPESLIAAIFFAMVEARR